MLQASAHREKATGDRENKSSFKLLPEEDETDSELNTPKVSTNDAVSVQTKCGPKTHLHKVKARFPDICGQLLVNFI